jgi:hypothetical protein
MRRPGDAIPPHLVAGKNSFPCHCTCFNQILDGGRGPPWGQLRYLETLAKILGTPEKLFFAYCLRTIHPRVSTCFEFHRTWKTKKHQVYSIYLLFFRYI